MVHIYLEHETEAVKLLHFVSVHPLGAELQSYIQLAPEKGLIVQIKGRYVEQLHILLSDAFYSFLFEDRLMNELERVIRQTFFYQEKEEVDAILDIAASIIEHQNEPNTISPFIEARRIIENGLQVILAEKVSFSFDSFVTFRLKSLFDSVEHFAGLAIDEYKMEQDYQNFIANLRNFLNGRKSQMPVIHLFHQNGFSFFDKTFRELGPMELNKMIDRRLLTGNPIYIDSTLAPLISIAPEILYVYTDDAEEGLVQTIARVFEEKALIRPLQSFSKMTSLIKQSD